MEVTVTSNGERDTLDLGRRIGLQLRGGEVICLAGPLGAGKTCMARGILEGAGVKGGVRSPSFNIMYVHSGRVNVYHFDVYRLDDPEEVWELGLAEAVGSDATVIVEWADRLGSWALSQLYVELSFGREEHQRVIRFCDRTGRYNWLLEKLGSEAGNVSTRD
ncbi:MAG: tRNA (adenosine(37)-N6)-threonylcarbamoyltransferase complex ATPase subunit type 1 TsaE [Bacillota bacterium]